MNYKNYQQVLDFASGKKATAGHRPVHAAKAAPKRRTKTGCLTCRSRKKKCDEETHGGKCQACIRNFLDCSWPEKEAKPAQTVSESSQAPVHGLATPKMEAKKFHQEQTKPSSTPCGASAYPSPVASPKIAAVENTKDFKSCSVKDKIQAITLPPIKMKVHKPESRRTGKPAKFIVTSFDSDRALLQIKS